MPQVGKKKFGYDPVGMAKANRASKTSNRPVQMDQNRGAVNSFMNRSTIEDRTKANSINPNPADVSRLQSGLNFLNKNNPEYTPLKVDGVMGQKTDNTARRYLGTTNKSSY